MGRQTEEVGEGGDTDRQTEEGENRQADRQRRGRHRQTDRPTEEVGVSK